MKSPPSAWRAFTLVEVVLGLAVASFCLLVLMGLFASGMKSSKQLSDETHLASLSWSVASELRATNSFLMSANNITTVPAYTNYYDINQQATNLAGAYYTCRIAPSASQPSPLLPSNTQVVQLTFTYPNVTPAPHTNVLYIFLPPL